MNVPIESRYPNAADGKIVEYVNRHRKGRIMFMMDYNDSNGFKLTIKQYYQFPYVFKW